MSTAETSGRTRLLGSIVLVAMFAAGTVFGVGLARWSAPPRPPGPPPPGGPTEAMIHELDLDAAQIATLRSIDAAHRGELDAIVRDTVPRVKAVLETIENELRPHLRPDQIEKLEAWRARRPPPPMMGAPPPPGGPPPPPP